MQAILPELAESMGLKAVANQRAEESENASLLGPLEYSADESFCGLVRDACARIEKRLMK
jgi:hypothetical protein